MKESAFQKPQKSNTLSKALPGLRRGFQEFWPQIRQQKLLLSVSCIGLVVELVAQLVSPWSLKFIFDYVILHDTDALALEFPMLADANQMVLL